MGEVTRGYCVRLVSNCRDEIERQKGKMNSNYADMDLKNASIEKEMRKAIDGMTSVCDSLIKKLDSYSFE